MGGTLTPLINAYARERYQRGEVGRTTAAEIRYRLHHLNESFGARPLDQLGPKAIDRWWATLREKSPATRRQYLSSARLFCRWLVNEGHIDKDPTTHLGTVPQPRRAPITLTADEVGRLLAAAPSRRDTAMLQLMVGCGCRCVEVARLRVEDYDPRGRTILLRGKGGHERIVPVPVAAARAIDAYLDEVGRVAGPLVRSQLRPTEGIAAATVSMRVRRLMVDAGVKVRALDGRSAHGLRRTAASDVMDRCGNIHVVREMLGHSQIETTAQYYLRRASVEQMREAMEGRDYPSVA